MAASRCACALRGLPRLASVEENSSPIVLQWDNSNTATVRSTNTAPLVLRRQLGAAAKKIGNSAHLSIAGRSNNKELDLSKLDVLQLAHHPSMESAHQLFAVYDDGRVVGWDVVV